MRVGLLGSGHAGGNAQDIAEQTPKNRFIGLDGLRGIAALAVLWYHYELFISHTGLVRHGYLAVDFFFVLSGFVISAVYERRLGQSITLTDFFKARIIRLYPMMLVATIIGLTLALTHITKITANAKMFVQQILFVPAYRTGGMVYPLNNTQWSLAFELVANVAHVFILRHLRVKWLAVVATLCGLCLIVLAAPGQSTDLGNGISSLFGGLARVGFSYTLGIIIFRLYKAGVFSRIRGSWALSAALLLAATCVPFLRHSALGYAQDLFSTIVLFPLVVILALNPGKSPFVDVWAERLGRLSYPLYILQSPIFDLGLAAIASTVGAVALGVKIGLLPFMVMIAWALLVGFDEPVRARLTRLLHAPRQHVAISAP